MIKHYCFCELKERKDRRFECSVCGKILTPVRFIKREK